MPAITPEFLFDLESNMRLITSRDYDRINNRLWWRQITKEMQSGSKKERLSWLLDTATIRPTGKGGNVEFEDMVAQSFELEHLNSAAGLELKKEQLEDLDGNGVDLASNWSRAIGAYAAYWPQKQVAKAILANPTTYDGKAFFATDHPVNPFRTANGTYRNIFTGGASGIYPGAVPIDVTNATTVETALANIAKAIAYIASIKMPNGEDPRFLELAGIMVPPALVARAQQLTNAKFIAQSTAAGGGSGDVEAVVRNFGLGQPIQVDEISSAFTNGSDTTYYLVMRDVLTSELGAFLYSNREPFAVIYHGPQTDAQLARIRRFQWTTEGRNVVQPGHPYLLFQCKAT